MAVWHIGCSGFHYKHWKGSFYPETLAQKSWFEYYCTHFNTLELNVTFYRFPRLSVLEKWYASSPAHFRFAVKAPRAITQFKKFNGVEKMMGDFYTTVQDGLKEKCGCYLFQLPPNFHYDPQKLARIIQNLDPDLPNVLEFRHESWWNEEVYETMASHQVSFCGMSHPNLPQTIIKNTPLLYYRFHGKEQLYASRYSEAELNIFADNIKADDQLKQAFIFFNNDINTNAVFNAKELKQILKT